MPVRKRVANRVALGPLDGRRFCLFATNIRSKSLLLKGIVEIVKRCIPFVVYEGHVIHS